MWADGGRIQLALGGRPSCELRSVRLSSGAPKAGAAANIVFLDSIFGVFWSFGWLSHWCRKLQSAVLPVLTEFMEGPSDPVSSISSTLIWTNGLSVAGVAVVGRRLPIDPRLAPALNSSSAFGAKCRRRSWRWSKSRWPSFLSIRFSAIVLAEHLGTDKRGRESVENTRRPITSRTNHQRAPYLRRCQYPRISHALDPGGLLPRR
jgi:hypothetical protein